MNAGKFSQVGLETLESRLVPTTFSLSGPGLVLTVDATQDKTFMTYKAANIKLTNDMVVNYSTNQSYKLPAGITEIRIAGSQTGDLIDAREFDLSTPKHRSVFNTKVLVYIYGGYGDDVIYGSKLSDNIEGGTGNDEIWGMDGNDRLYGNDGNDFVDGGYGNDIIWGGNGNDRLFAGDVTSKIYDPIQYPWGQKSLFLSGQLDYNSETMWGKSSYCFNFDINSTYRGDVVYGESGNDYIYGRVDAKLNSSHNIMMVGGLGKDFFDGETKVDDMLQNDCVCVAVDRTMFYTSKKLVKGSYVYTGVTYEQLAPRTRFVNSYTTQPLVWNYGWSA